MDWNKLIRSEIFEKIKAEWASLLNNKNLKERDYHEFIRNHPSLFFNLSFDTYLVVSKLKLGSEYETDFVVVREGYSDGTTYELIEIESPHSPLFDKSGKPSSKFNSSIQQVRDWRRWLANNRTERKRLFPTTSTRVIKDSKLKYKIIIGLPDENEETMEKRRQISESENIEIMSFNRLTENLNRVMYLPTEPLLASPEMDSIDWDMKNQLANPFYVCHSHSDWRKICKKGSFHIYSRIYKEIIESRTYNKYFDEFKEENGA